MPVTLVHIIQASIHVDVAVQHSARHLNALIMGEPLVASWVFATRVLQYQSGQAAALGTRYGRNEEV
jgi:hypothetical protein